MDDHQDTLRGVTLALEANGAAVTAVSSASAALAELDRRRPDVLVSDIAMPGMDGHDLIRAVRGRPDSGGGSTPAIALSAYVSPEDRERALEAGYGEHVAKPVEIPHLVATIARLAARSGSSRCVRDLGGVPPASGSWPGRRSGRRRLKEYVLRPQRAITEPLRPAIPLLEGSDNTAFATHPNGIAWAAARAASGSPSRSCT